MFGAASPLELIIAFASGDANDTKLIEKNTLGELRNLVQSELGLDFSEAKAPVEARMALRRMILWPNLPQRFPSSGDPLL